MNPERSSAKTLMKPENIYILANAQARTLDRQGLQAAAELISRHVKCRIELTQSLQHATDLTKKLAADSQNLVVACGGDGTINTILNALPAEAAMGIIPAGTANVIARELGIPLNIREAGKAILTGAVKNVDVAVCNGQRYLFVAGFGFDAQVAGAVNPVLKRLIGRAAYHVTGLMQFITYKPPFLNICTDSQQHLCGRFAIIANMRRYGGELFFAPDARFDDKILDLVLVQQFNVSSLLRLLNYARRNGRFPDKQAVQLRTSKLRIQTANPIPWQLDGEVFAPAAEFELHVAPEPARIITP